MGITAKHFPIFVPCDESDLLNGEARLEEAAGSFMSEIVKVRSR